ncbi:MAG: beta-propeller domain-containing protein [Deltaproteobacteria bacterium]|nr:beta-propeller domain-containing protein [Deltaproteobacteria bacterium]
MTTRTLLLVLAVAAAGCTDDDLGAPDDHVAAKTTQLVQYGSCSELENDLEGMLIREAWANIDRYDPRFGFGAEDASGDAGGGSPTQGGGREEGVDFSGTNNQEQGVDEADLVKTDGYHVYALNGNRLHIYGTPQFGDLIPESVTQIEGHPREMLFDKDAGRAVVFSYIYVNGLPKGHPLRHLTGVGNDDDGSWYWRSSLLTKMTVLDISDRTRPRLVREVYYEGWYQTARKVNTSVRVSTYASIDQPILWNWYQLLEQSGNNKSWTKKEIARRIRALRLADMIPQMFIRAPDGNFTTSGLDQQSCQSFYRPTDSHARGISSIISFDLLGPQFRWDADHVVSNWATFYSSKDRIVLAEASHDWWWYWWFQDDADQLNVHVFDISQPGKSSYLGSGRVEGQLSDQFAIDEDDGEIRLATTTNIWWRWWSRQDETPPEMENHVWILEQDGTQFPVIGHVGNIALGERIQSARFLGDKGYLVTFKRIDPLFTLDLSNKTDPRVIGELKTPGFSTYIHPLGENRLLTIGVGGDENGANWRTTVATFDVTKFDTPTLSASLPIESDLSWGWSEALWEHKAFQYFGPKKLLAVPQSTWANNGGDYRYLSRLEVIDVNDTTGALSLKGSIDHTPFYDRNKYWSYLQIRRSIFMGDFLYAISDRAITVHRLSDLAQTNVQTLPGYTANDWYWWY